MWKTGVRIIEDHPLFGIGDVGTETVWNRYSDPGWTWEGHLHNNLIMWLVTLGAVGCTVIVWIFVRMWRVFSRIERKFRDDWLAGSLALGGLAVIVGFQVNGLFEWNFGDAEIITLMWAILGLVLVADNVIRPPGGSPA
jgi:O-antigen ligase